MPSPSTDRQSSPAGKGLARAEDALRHAQDAAAKRSRLAKALADKLPGVGLQTLLPDAEQDRLGVAHSVSDAKDAVDRARYLDGLDWQGGVYRDLEGDEIERLADRAEFDATEVERKEQTLEKVLAKLEHDCDPATLEKGLLVYSNDGEPPQDPEPPVVTTDVGDLNGDGRADLVVEYQAARTGRAIKVYVREPAPKCFREVYNGQGGGVGLAPERHAGWTDIKFGVQELFAGCGFGWMTVQARYDDGRYRVRSGDSCSCRYNSERTISKADCSAAADGEVCRGNGLAGREACARQCAQGDLAACRSACTSWDTKSCERGCRLRDRGACDSLCPLDSGVCRSLCSAGNNVACAADCDQNIESPSCLVLCKKKDAKACANSCITSQAPCNALCKAGNEAACTAADPEVAEQAEAAAAQREQAVAEAKLAGLFDKCEQNRALVLGVKKRWIAARRAGDQSGSDAAGKQMDGLEPQWGRTLSEIREAIRVVSGDHGPKFVRYVREVERRCSLPQWAGF